MNTKLSICIPTYNRSTYLYETVLAFIPQLLPYGIEICISDNSDNIETEKMVELLLEIYPHIRYQRNKNNIGIDRNIYAATAMAKSEYFWIFGDDDLPESDAIDQIYAKLSDNPDLLMINSCPVGKNMEPMRVKNLVGLYEDRSYTNAEKFLVDLSWYSTFIGGLVVNKGLWSTIKPDRYYDTVFVHVGIIFEMLKNKEPSIHFISKPLIFYRTDNASWSAEHTKIQLELWPKVIELLPNSYSDSAKELAILNVSCRFMTFGVLLKMKLKGQYDFLIFKKYILNFWRNRESQLGRSGKLFIVGILTLILPCPVIEKMYFFKNKYRK